MKESVGDVEDRFRDETTKSESFLVVCRVEDHSGNVEGT